jgi:hypothetical protein
MNEFRQLCERVLEIPAPARASSAQMLALARRSARRRARLRLLSSTLALAGVALVVGQATAPLTPPPAESKVEWAQMPPPEAVASYQNQAADVVDRAIPGPLLAPSWSVIEPDGNRKALRLLYYTEDDDKGALMVYFQNVEQPLAFDDLCAPEVAAQIVGMPWGAIDLCYEMAVNGQPVRVAVGEDIVVATRFLIDGFVTVVARQGSAAVFTPRQLAEIAADPDMLPRPAG